MSAAVPPGSDDARFAAVLEECCLRLQCGEDLARCLNSYPAEYRAELARLAPLSAQLAKLGHDPSAEFQARLEQRLLAAMREARQARRPGLLERLAGAVAGVSLVRAAVVALVVMLLLVAGGAGLVQASEGSLPDSPLYRIKIAREWLQLQLTRSGDERLGVYAAQILQRGRELDRAVRAGAPRRVIEVLALRLAWSTDRLVDQALELHARGNTQPATRTLTLVRAIQRELDPLEGQAQPEARPVLQRLQRFLEGQERRLANALAVE